MTHVAAFVPCMTGVRPPPSHEHAAATCAARTAGVAVAVAVATLTGLNIPPVLAQQPAEILVYDHDQTLVGADFSNRTDLVGAIFSKANATRATFAKSDMRNAQLDDTVLIEAVLDDADCTNVLGTKAKLTRASLRNTIFTSANLVSAGMGGVDITGADFTDALIDPATVNMLCARASGTNPHTGVDTRESLICPEE